MPPVLTGMNIANTPQHTMETRIEFCLRHRNVCFDPSAMTVTLQSVKRDEIEVGKPLPWPVYNQNNQLLLQAGYVIQTQSQKDALISEGLFVDSGWSGHSRAADVLESPEQGKKSPLKETTFLAAGTWVGELIQMQSLNDAAMRYYVKCIGYQEKHSILVTTPAVDGKPLLVKEGGAYTFRAFSGRNICTFNASVLRSCHVPYPYLHVTYPAIVQAMAVRKAQRVKANLIASVKTGADENGAGARIVDLSAHGAQLRIANPLLGVDESVKVLFRLEPDVYLTLDADIRNMSRDDGDGKATYVYGVEFREVSRQDDAFLRNYIYQHMSGGPG